MEKRPPKAGPTQWAREGKLGWRLALGVGVLVGAGLMAFAALSEIVPGVATEQKSLAKAARPGGVGSTTK